MESISILYQRLVINMSCLVNEEVLERLYEDFLELGYCEEDAVVSAQEEFDKQQ